MTTTKTRHAPRCPTAHIPREECGVCCPPSPGPWTASGHTVYGPDGETVIGAAFRAGDEEFDGVDERASLAPDGNGAATANARLIAAAPDLLAALEECNDVLTKLRQSMKIEERNEHHNYADHGVRCARAAIAKARGK